MKIELRHNSRWSLLVPTSMGVRFTPVNGQPVHSSSLFSMQVTSAETNVASIASYLGLPVKVLTVFVKGSPIARLIKDNLSSRHMNYEGKEIEQGGPWGYRHQFNIADSGYSIRGPRVYNDRAGEVGRMLDVKDFDLDRIFGTEGVQIVHLSGIIAALSSSTGEFCLELARTAKKYGTKISFDLNYRASFWEGREIELREIFTEIAANSDILIGNGDHFQLCLGTAKSYTGGEIIKDPKFDNYKSIIADVKKKNSNISVIATTSRQEISSNTHLWGALMLADDNLYTVDPREINVLDRIGGGDGFVGGMLYAILKGWDTEKWIQFGWASGALATTFITDYAQPADEDQIWSVWNGKVHVKR